jgi:hypothetical protein
MKNDKMQMSYVPQTTEHKLISSNGTFDFTLPHGAIVEDVVVVKKVLDSTATTATLNIGTTAALGNNVAAANYYTPTAIDIDTTNGHVGVAGIDAGKMMEPVASNRVVRVTTANLAANSVARIYVWVNYRFAPQNYNVVSGQVSTPTRVA